LLSIAIGGGPFDGAPAGASGQPVRRHPDWIRSKLPSGDNYHDLKGLLRGLNLNTVCEEARCPNIGECWEQRTATVMILGDTCTRACGFCAVKTGRPDWSDADEPRRVAEAIAVMGLEHVVVTSVCRDDLADGGAGAFAATIRELRRLSPDTGVEVLIPDYLDEPLRTASATRAGSSRSRAAGLPCCTAQNPHARVQTSPRIMNVAVPWCQHSPMFGQRASSQTVCRPCSRMSPFSRR
jgi:hypothetical protein